MDNWNNMYMPGNKGNRNLQGQPNTISPLNYDSVNEPTEQKTDFGTRFYTCDGREVSSIEEVMMYNQMYYERMKNQIEPNIERPSGIHR